MAKISRKEIFSIPNLMGYFRILMIPVFSWMYLTASTREDVYRAAAVVFISSVTDLLDGWVARRFHMVTELGKFVDPLADKLTHGALALCLAFKYPLMWALAALLAVKEGYMAVMGLILLKRGKKLDGAMWFGKVCTALLFVGMLVLFLWYGMPEAAANGLILFMMAVMAAALLMKHKNGKKNGGICHLQGFRHFSSDQGTSLPGVSQKVFSLPGANSGTGSAPFVQGDTELTGSPPDPPGAYPRQ